MEARRLLEQYHDVVIPDDQKVNVMGIMLESFSDFTDFPRLAEQEEVQEVYELWHELESKSVSGNLLTNIFAGGTVNSEWGFVTGYTQHNSFVKPTDSYVWYLKSEGYQTFGSHPGYSWFYSRERINSYLGFDEYWFSENHYGDLVDPVMAQFWSDDILVQELETQIKDRVKDGPCFSFSVSYQNHGPYDSETDAEEPTLTSDSGFSQPSRYILNNYLMGVKHTIEQLYGLTEFLEEMEEPVVLVLFGDHKPWAGNYESVYREMNVNFDVSTIEGFYNYYSTPYIIWANSVAKGILPGNFVGEGGDFSPCLLMTKIFDLCGWKGPGFMQYSREIRNISPLLHEQGLFLQNGELTDTLSDEDQMKFDDFLYAQYYRETEVVPAGSE